MRFSRFCAREPKHGSIHFLHPTSRHATQNGGVVAFAAVNLVHVRLVGGLRCAHRGFDQQRAASFVGRAAILGPGAESASCTAVLQIFGRGPFFKAKGDVSEIRSTACKLIRIYL